MLQSYYTGRRKINSHFWVTLPPGFLVIKTDEKKRQYIIEGCNGAGKTTASYTILPEMLNCNEFINADEIAKGLSPFHPEKAALAAGRLMLSRIKELFRSGETLAFETTLATKSYVSLLKLAKQDGYC